MSVQDDKGTEDDKRTEDEPKDDRASSRSEQADQTGGKDDEQPLTEKPEPDEDAKQKAAEMMEAYKEKPTIVLPGTGGSVSGTAVNDWLDDEGNPRHEEPEGSDDKGSNAEGADDKGSNAEGSDAQRSDAQGSDAQDSDAEGKDDGQRDEEALKEQIEKDKALNEKLREAAQEENKGEKANKGQKG